MSGIVDQYGRAISSRAFFKASNNNDGVRPSIPIRALDPLKKLLTYRDWNTISYLASRVFANFGIVKGAICQKAIYSVGNAWSPVFTGEDREWGEMARTWLVEQWFPTCDVRGPMFDFVTGLYLDSITIDRDGDSITMLTKSDNTGWPMIQRIPTRQIGQWATGTSGDTIIEDGTFKGAILRNGVILNRQERPIGYRKLGEENGKYEDIEARYVSQIFDPEWYEQCRGLPLMSASIEEFRDIAQSDEWERQAMLIASAIGLIEYNESGDDADGTGTDPEKLLSQTTVTTGADPTVRLLDGGLVRYFRANSGGKLEQFLNNRPTAEWDAFQDRQVRKALAGANWPYSMVWKSDGSNGTVQRSELNKAKAAVIDRQSLLLPHAKRMVGYAVSVAQNIGALPQYRGRDLGGALKWDFIMPASITIDEGRDKDQQREDLKGGITTLQRVCTERGTTWQAVREQRHVEVDDLLTRAKSISDKHQITIDAALVLLQQGNANSTAPAGGLEQPAQNVQ